MVQAAIKIVLEPQFEDDSRDCSFGFRPKRSAQQVRERIRRGSQREQRPWVVDADISGFFDNGDREILRALLRRRISDRRSSSSDRWSRGHPPQLLPAPPATTPKTLDI